MQITQKKKNCLFLWDNKEKFHAVEASKREVDVAQIYKQLPLLFRAIRRVQFEANISWIYPWLSSWKNNLSFYDVVIIHASKLTPPVVKFIHNKYPEIRIIVWYWNPVNKSVDVEKFSGLDCEIWSFDKIDCKKFGLNFNTQYYFDNICLKNNKNEFDVIFVGSDKGRKRNLEKIQMKLNDLGISTYFHISPTGKLITGKIKYFNKKYKISYKKYLDYISKSKAILDYVSNNQSGLTLRSLEAIFLKKKLITNDSSVTNLSFYNPENIFIYGKDDINSLLKFLESPYKEVDGEVLKFYDFDSWFHRFFQ